MEWEEISHECVYCFGDCCCPGTMDDDCAGCNSCRLVIAEAAEEDAE